jgi:hypothetical protein
MKIEAKVVEVIETPGEITTGEWWGIAAAAVGLVGTIIRASES